MKLIWIESVQGRAYKCIHEANLWHKSKIVMLSMELYSFRTALIFLFNQKQLQYWLRQWEKKPDFGESQLLVISLHFKFQ